MSESNNRCYRSINSIPLHTMNRSRIGERYENKFNQSKKSHSTELARKLQCYIRIHAFRRMKYNHIYGIHLRKRSRVSKRNNNKHYSDSQNRYTKHRAELNSSKLMNLGCHQQIPYHHLYRWNFQTHAKHH